MKEIAERTDFFSQIQLFIKAQNHSHTALSWNFFVACVKKCRCEVVYILQVGSFQHFFIEIDFEIMICNLGIYC